MHFSPSSQFDWSAAKLPQVGPRRGATPDAGSAGRKPDCGWYDSSFDLTRGLEVMEQDDDALYQLWALART